MEFWRTPLDIDKLKIPRGELHIIKERCKGCGFWVESCPKGVMELSNPTSVSIVISARYCVRILRFIAYGLRERNRRWLIESRP